MIEYNGELYVGGYFSSIGGIITNNLAKWNGTTWSKVGDGQALISSGLRQVLDLYVHNGKLYVGPGTMPDFNNYNKFVGGLVWDGTAWDSIATPQMLSEPFCAYNGKIYVNGGNTLGGNSLFSVDE
jgi:hypothetical protein